MKTLESLSEDLECEIGFPPSSVEKEMPSEANFRPFIENIERFDSEEFIYIREQAKCYKIPRTNRIQIYLMGLRYLHDFQT